PSAKRRKGDVLRHTRTYDSTNGGIRACGRRVGGTLHQIGHFSTDCGEPAATPDSRGTSNHPADSECTGTPSPARQMLSWLGAGARGIATWLLLPVQFVS